MSVQSSPKNTSNNSRRTIKAATGGTEIKNECIYYDKIKGAAAIVGEHLFKVSPVFENQDFFISSLLFLSFSPSR
jgi:hypothetical protein